MCSSFSFKTETWNNSTDCCEWDGVTCDNVSDYVIGLDLSCNNLKGRLHPNSTIFQLRHLQQLNLAFNDFSGSSVHVGIGDLVNLTHLNLSNSYLSGNIPSTISHLSKLVSLDLSSSFVQVLKLKLNPFTWKKLIHNATNLNELYLDRVDMSSIRESSLSMLKNLSSSLVSLSLSYTGLQGKLSSDILSLPNLQKLDLSDNENLIGQLPKSNWSTPLSKVESISSPYLGRLDLSFSKINSFPKLPKQQPNLQTLDLSHNNIQGKIPKWFHKLLNSLGNIGYIDLSFNELQGDLPIPPHGIYYVLLSNNNFTGNISSIFCNASDLEVLNLAHNKLTGMIPQCLGTLPYLSVLDLQMNNLYGSLPRNFSKENQLETIKLNGNQLEGPLPTSCIKNFQAMMNVNDSQIGLQYMDIRVGGGSGYYHDSVVVIMKGLFTELTRILTTFTTIDLSNNKFEGEIPQLIGDLKFLKGLNLSNNGIKGTIPQSLSYLRNLEWLDLSRNQLRGEIPMALTKLNFLSFLNLSQNHLEGMIPKGQQFDTFGNESYEGNTMLCGFPLSKSCKNDDDQPPHSTSEDEEESGFGWKAVAIGYACGALSGLLLGHNVFFFGKPEWLARLVEQTFNMRLKRTNNSAGANRRIMN
ncbi:hypothetical protein TSUD_250490 [Trifolium subterraneum]|nr:hypothetical protein TSUD_250490 [Trifolium subterraneum]